MKKVVCWMLLSGIVGSTVSVQAQDPGPVSPSLATGATYVWGPRIQEHYLWVSLGDEAVDRLTDLYEKGIRSDVPAGYLKQHGNTAQIITNVLGAIAFSSFGLAVAHDKSDPSPGTGYALMGVGVTATIPTSIAATVSMRNDYREKAQAIETSFAKIREKNLDATQLREVFSSALIGSIAAILEQNKKANRWLDSASPKAEDRLETHITYAIRAGLLAPYVVYTAEEFPSTNNPIFEGMLEKIRAERKAHQAQEAETARQEQAQEAESRRIEREKAAQEKTEARERKAQARRDRSKN